MGEAKRKTLVRQKEAVALATFGGRIHGVEPSRRRDPALAVAIFPLRHCRRRRRFCLEQRLTRRLSSPGLGVLPGGCCPVKRVGIVGCTSPGCRAHPTFSGR